MPGETTHYKIKYAEAADEVKAFPAEVSKPGAETIDKELYEGNKVANGQVYGALTTRTNGTEYEPSATRATLVILEAISTTSSKIIVKVGGVTLAGPIINGTPGEKQVSSLTFICPAGLKWVTEGVVGTLKSSYLSL